MKAKRLTKAQRLSKAKRLSSDIITTLPQAVIETILCLLPIDKAARTSILSKEWRYKWTKIPKLVFSHPYGEQIMETSKLFCAINQIMLLRQAPIQEFTLFIDEDEDEDEHGPFSKFGYPCYEVDQIMLHLLRNDSVSKLKLLFDEPRSSSSYKLPVSFFSLQHLTELELSWCDLDHQPTFNGFGRLTSLYLECVRVSMKTLLHLMSKSPSLKSCTLLMLEESIIGPEKSTMIELFESLPVIEHLSIWSDIIPWFVPDLVPQELLTSLIHLKYFFLEDMTFHDGYGLTFLAVLIKSSPNLEKLELEIDPHHHLCNEIDQDHVYEKYHSDVWLEHISDVWLDHLDELEIKGFTNLEAELEFVKFILARSPKLKKVSITTTELEEDQESDMLKTLLRAPRASTMVEIDID